MSNAEKSIPVTPYHHWRHDVMCLAGATYDDCKPHERRMMIWFDAGETREGAAQMIRTFMDAEKKPLVRPMTRERLIAAGCKFS